MRPIDICTPVLLLFDADDIGCALVAREQILAVLGVEEFSQRLDPTDDRNEARLPAADIEHGVDKVVPRSLFTQLHLEPFVEEMNKAVARVRDFSIGHFWPKLLHVHLEHPAR